MYQYTWLLQVTQSFCPDPKGWSGTCHFLTTIQQFKFVFSKEAHFIIKQQSYLREFFFFWGGRWQQELRAFITGWWVHLSGELSSLTGGTIFSLQTTFFFLWSSRKWPQNLMASRFRTPTPGLRVSNLNFQKRCFDLLSLAGMSTPAPVGCDKRELGVIYHESGTHHFGDAVTVEKCVTPKGVCSICDKNMTSYHLPLDHIWDVSLSLWECFRELIDKGRGSENLKILNFIEKIKSEDRQANLIKKCNVDEFAILFIEIHDKTIKSSLASVAQWLSIDL